MPRYLRIYVAVAAFALLAAVHYYLPPFHRSAPPSPGAEPYFASSPSSGVFDGEDGQRTDSSGVVADKKGLMSYSPGHARHPVEMLIEKGKKLAEEMEHRIASVNSVRDSAKDYLLAFGMRPPRGFDAWYVAAAHSSISFSYGVDFSTPGMRIRKASLHLIHLLFPHSSLLSINPCFRFSPTQLHCCARVSRSYVTLTNPSLH